MYDARLDRLFRGRGWLKHDPDGAITLPPHIRLCGCCGGTGEYEQLYNAGCGMGHYRSVGRCDWCNGTGLKLLIENPFVDTGRMEVDFGDASPLFARLEQRREAA